jgi:diaminobutyrate-2-oxoglutarate transaminase
MLDIFEARESVVRSYCRSFPVLFEAADGPFLFDTQGRRYIDFFCGAGAINYGHNEPSMKRAIIDYLETNGIIHSLDLATSAKRQFLEKFISVILEPRELDYKVQFVGPTGASAVEAALKLARLVTQRSHVIAFTRAYHGLSAGALSVTADSFYRNKAYCSRSDVSFMPFDGYFGESVDTIEYLRKFLEDKSSGIDLPAAVIVETVQAEGGVNVARKEWLRGLEALCLEHGILLVVDDIQVGCGKTGDFFSFEAAGIKPDIVTLSKAISGFGLPMSLLVFKKELDQWKPGEHTGTFRGNNLAFVTGAVALERWRNGEVTRNVAERSAILAQELATIAADFPQLGPHVRGQGLIFGLQLEAPKIAQMVATTSFAHGVIIELCGPRRDVLKFLPPLVIEPSVLLDGLGRIREAIEAVFKSAAAA